MPRRRRKVVHLKARSGQAKQVRERIGVELELGVFDGADTGAKWVQVTREGNFPGYAGGLKPFAFTRQDLEQMAVNLRTHPSFVEGGDGVGTANVIPWDFNHASESNPTAGNLPVEGAPSQGWTLDMQVRDADDGTAELWALTQFLEPARTYVKTGQYQWASVAVTFNAIDPVSGQNVGSYITSIALTNTPFIEGMDKLVASAQGSGDDKHVEARRMFFEAASNASEAIGMMREMFALPETAGAAEVMQQVGIVAQWVASGTAPLGTNPEDLISNMRIILNLPTLTSQMEVLEEATRSIQALLEEQTTGADIVPNDGIVPEPEMLAAARRKETTMDLEKLIQALASSLGVRQNEEAILSAAKDLGDLRIALVSHYKLDRDGNIVILAAAKDGADAREKLTSLFTALGVENPEAALDKIAKTMDDAKRLAEVMPELTELKVSQEKAEEASIETDVDAAIAASNLPALARPALLLQRKSDPKGFAEAFPKSVQAASGGVGSRPDLLRKVATDGTTPLVSDGTTVRLNGNPVSPDALPDKIGGQDTINLALQPGENATACAKLYLASTNAGWDKMTPEQQHVMACTFKKQAHVVYQLIH